MEVSVLAFAELHILQGLEDGHLGGCTRGGVASAWASGMPHHQESLPVLESIPSTPPQSLQTSTQGTTQS